ncbi:MAG: phosphatidylserine decarboxylase family protein [Bacteroidetes bacterium]|nr:phosphatidylserine decarboxylase family protein [Bacteroidota bacterium]
MTLTRYGYDNALIMIAVGATIISIAYIFARGWFAWLIIALGALIICFTLWFFRDPERTIPIEAKNDDSIILAPADGKIVEVTPVREENYLHSEAIQISIFLSPLDVHVNRSPVTGNVGFYKYIPGDYLVAWHPKSSELNEQSRIGVQTANGKVLFKQITGYLARRIVCEVKEGDSLQSGEKIGMMKFGSRMDIIVPTSSVINVKIGDVVVGGETILGKIR